MEEIKLMSLIENCVMHVKEFFNKNRLEVFLILLIFAFGTFLRFYKISGYATFLGDEGRDAFVVKRMIVDHKFTLLGPTTSLGQMYLGPAYYYMMVIPLWLSGLNPVGPAIMIALFGSFTILLVWLLGREFFSVWAGLIASGLYAVSLLVINHTRSSWNPNPMPFFASLAFLSLFKSLKDKKGKWLVVVGSSLGIAFQLHYISFVLIGTIIFIYFFYGLLLKIRFSTKWYLLGIFSFLLMILPQIAFELRHNFVNLKSVFNFIVGRKDAEAGLGLKRFFPLTLYKRLFTSLLAQNRILLGNLLAYFSGLAVGVSLVKSRDFKGKDLGLGILLLWLILGVLGVPLYEGRIHDHYLGFLFPVPFLLLGGAVSQIVKFKKVLKPIFTGLVLALFIFNFLKTDIPKKVGPNYQIQRVKLISDTIANDVSTSNFNISLTSPTKDFQALHYRYFLNLEGKDPKDYGQYQDLETLYVIVEVDPRTPEELGSWEIGTFGPFTLENKWDFDFQVKLYKLKKRTG